MGEPSIYVLSANVAVEAGIALGFGAALGAGLAIILIDLIGKALDLASYAVKRLFSGAD